MASPEAMPGPTEPLVFDFKPKCQLECMTGRIFVVEVEKLKKAVVLKSMLDDLGIGTKPNVEVDEDVIPLPNLSEKCMEKLLEWLEQHKDDPDPPGGDEDFNFKDEIDEWDLEFLKMDDGTLFDLILAANYLDIKGLLDITTTYVARLITDLKSPEEIRKRFNIKNDLTPEDLEEIKKESEHWLEDDDPAAAPPAAPGASDPGAGPSGASSDPASPAQGEPMPGTSSEGQEEGAVGGEPK